MMSKEAVFTMKLEHDLRDEFMAEAEASHRPASQIVRDFMRDFVQHQRQSREHDSWFRKEVQSSIDDQQSQVFTHEQVMEDMKSRFEARLSKEKKRED
ncbi:MAG: hypothetical protein Q8R24_03625 [Legionellaceae bacterium]|nr:hypothetical protein [Legionellaceae bacterium]